MDTTPGADTAPDTGQDTMPVSTGHEDVDTGIGQDTNSGQGTGHARHRVVLRVLNVTSMVFLAAAVAAMAAGNLEATIGAVVLATPPLAAAEIRAGRPVWAAAITASTTALCVTAGISQGKAGGAAFLAIFGVALSLGAWDAANRRRARHAGEC